MVAVSNLVMAPFVSFRSESGWVASLEAAFDVKHGMSRGGSCWSGNSPGPRAPSGGLH